MLSICLFLKTSATFLFTLFKKKRFNTSYIDMISDSTHLCAGQVELLLECLCWERKPNRYRMNKQQAVMIIVLWLVDSPIVVYSHLIGGSVL